MQNTRLRMLCFLALASAFLSTIEAATLPAVVKTGTLNVNILIMPGVFISEATIPFDMYKHVPKDGARVQVNVNFVAETMTPVYTYYGTQLKPDKTFANAPQSDILVIPSGIGSHDSFLTSWYSGEQEAATGIVTGKTQNNKPVVYYGNVSTLITWVKAQANLAKVVTSHCWGAFTLADAGVLDGKTATTFPGYTKTLDDNYPDISAVVANQRYVIDGKIMTSVGALGAFEACLAVIKHIYGETIATKIGTDLVFSPHNIGHSTLSYYKPSPAAVGAAPATPEKKVGILLLAGAYITEPVGPFDVYKHMGSADEEGSAMKKTFFIGETMDPITTGYGATMYPDYTMATAPAFHVLVVPSAQNSMTTDLDKTAVISFLTTQAKTVEWITSHCWGAFMLAKAGLLDGKQATTFPGDTDKLHAAFPLVKVSTSRIVRDGKIITSNGGVAAYEASNYVVHEIYGDYWARKVATGLVFSKDNYDAMSAVHIAMSTTTASTASTASTSGAGAEAGAAVHAASFGFAPALLVVASVMVMAQIA